MKRCLLIATALWACAYAAAYVRVFVTSSASGYGLDLLGPQGDGTGTDPGHENWPIDPFRPTYSTVDLDGHNFYGYDYYYAYYRVAAYPPMDAPSGTAGNPILINAAAGEWAYIWFQFRNEGAGSKVNEMETVATLAGHPYQPVQDLTFTYYVQNDSYGTGIERWDGQATPPDYPEWRQNPSPFLALRERGLTNSLDDPVVMLDHQAPGTGVALLGAVRGAPSDQVYELRISEGSIGYASGGVPTLGANCFFRIIPEPGTVFLATLAAIWLRRRV